MDYRKFLGKTESLVLPYLGGPSVFAEARRLRLKHEVPPGWWRFDVKGRDATAAEPAEAPDLSRFDQVRGHFCRGFLFAAGQRAERVELLPVEELAAFAPIRARRWPSGELLFEGAEFETEAEEAARRALEERRSLAEQKGIPASLRAAFGFAVFAECSRRLGIGVSPGEVRAELANAAEHGAPAAEQVLRRLDAARRLDVLRGEARGQAVAEAARRHWRRYDPSDPESVQEQASQILAAAGATLSTTRRLDARQLEVRFRFMGERFISIVDVTTFQVLDAGICLSGSDRMVTLDSLPSVIKEAIDTDQLNITRR